MKHQGLSGGRRERRAAARSDVRGVDDRRRPHAHEPDSVAQPHTLEKQSRFHLRLDGHRRHRGSVGAPGGRIGRPPRQYEGRRPAGRTRALVAAVLGSKLHPAERQPACRSRQPAATRCSVSSRRVPDAARSRSSSTAPYSRGRGGRRAPGSTPTIAAGAARTGSRTHA